MQIRLISNYRVGHHPTYTRLFAKTFLELGHDVGVLCPDARETRRWLEENALGHQERCQVVSYQPVFSGNSGLGKAVGVLKAWRHTASLIRGMSGAKPDLVFFAWLDDYAARYVEPWMIDAVFPYSWSGLLFHPSRCLREAHPSPAGSVSYKGWRGIARSVVPLAVWRTFGHIKRRIHLTPPPFRCRHCSSVGFLDEGAAETARPLEGAPIIVFPDFADESCVSRDFGLVRQILEKAKGRRIVGLLGEQSERKGTDLLMEVASGMTSENLFFVFAGQWSARPFQHETFARMEAFMSRAPGNCFFHFERIPDESQFNALADACDILYAAYRNFRHSSNILTKAALFHKPVLVSEGYCMAKRVERHRLGRSVPEGNAQACSRALREMCRDDTLHSLKTSADFEGYAQLHSLERLKEALREVVHHAESLGQRRQNAR